MHGIQRNGPVPEVRVGSSSEVVEEEEEEEEEEELHR